MNTTTRSLLCGALLLAGLALAPGVRAENEQRPEKPKKEQRQERRGDRLEMLKEELALTDAQIEKLKPIFAAEREEIMAARKELGKDADRDAVREKMQAIREEYRPQIAAILTEEQKAKMSALRERGPKGPKGPGAGGPPPAE
jgi:Spy/CpxP family protein refolding chaperone